MGIAADDLTLDQLAVALAPAIADAAVFDGWTPPAVRAAAEMEGVDPDVALLAFPGGAMDMIAAWIASIDAAMAQALPATALENMGVGQRIRAMLVFRLEALAPRHEAFRRAMAIMAMPQNVKRSAKTGWRSADLMWRMAGDKAADFNHYSKRAILSSVYASTLAVFSQDESEGFADTYAFLDRRLKDVAGFGKFTARFKRDDAERFSPMRLLGRLRYPAR